MSVLIKVGDWMTHGRSPDGFIHSLASLIKRENVWQQLGNFLKIIGLPLLAISLLLLVWWALHRSIETSLGALPGPVQVVQAGGQLYQEYLNEGDKAALHYDKEIVRNEQRYTRALNQLAQAGALTADGLAAKLDKRIGSMDVTALTAFIGQYQDLNSTTLQAAVTAKMKIRPYTGPPTYLDQIITSLLTVFVGFLLATIIAIPVGILCGLIPSLNKALGPIIQVFKPISPLAWLPIVTLVVSALVTSSEPWLDKAFLVSAIVVALCALWPTLINTAVGVANINQDYLNVSKVIQLSWLSTIGKVAIPAALPMIFTGLRISLGIGWMVLIAAEMLAQNPGLGKFVWDEFQNGSSDSMARIAFAVWTIGLIGFVLDRLMVMLHSWVAHEEPAS